MGKLMDLKITIVSQNWKTYITKFNIINIYLYYRYCYNRVSKLFEIFN